MMRIILVLTCIFLSFQQINGYAQDDPYLWDFGQVEQGTVLAHDFVLKNESNEVLNIKGVDTSCGCTVSKVRKRRLLPQESTLIRVQFKTKDYLGPTQQFIYVFTDSLDKPVIRYIIKADVIKE